MIAADAPPSFDAHREGTFATVHSAAPFYSVLIRINPDNPGSATDFVCDLCTEVPQPTDNGIVRIGILGALQVRDSSGRLVPVGGPRVRSTSTSRAVGMGKPRSWQLFGTRRHRSRCSASISPTASERARSIPSTKGARSRPRRRAFRRPLRSPRRVGASGATRWPAVHSETPGPTSSTTPTEPGTSSPTPISA